MNNEELANFSNSWMQTLACWCAKEAVYKLAAQPGLIFQSQILITGKPFEGSFGALLLPHPTAEPIPIILTLQDLPGHLLVTAEHSV